MEDLFSARFPIFYIWTPLLVLDFLTRQMNLTTLLETWKLLLIHIYFSSRYHLKQRTIKCTLKLLYFVYVKVLAFLKICAVWLVVWVISGVPCKSIFYCWRVICWNLRPNSGLWSSKRYFFWSMKRTCFVKLVKL